MQIAYLLYDRFTALDIIGPHDVLNSVPGNESIFVAEKPGPIRNESDTLSLVADASLDEVPEPRHRRRPRRLRQPDAARARAAARVDPRCTRPPPGPPRSAPARCCSPPRVCSTASPRRPTGWLATCSPSSGPSRSPTVWSSTARSSRRPASPPASTWPWGSSADQRRRGRAGRSARHRVRPPAAARRRLAGEGSAGDRRAGHSRLRGPGGGGAAHLAFASTIPL